jgi:hypothetical protein
MPDSPTLTPDEQARTLALERILLSLDTLARAESGSDLEYVSDACEGLARYLRARGRLGSTLSVYDHSDTFFEPSALDPGFDLPPPMTPASAQPPAVPAAAPAAPAPAVAPLTAPGGPPCEEQTLQKQDPKRRIMLAKDGLVYLERVNYYLQLAAAHAAATDRDGKPLPNTAGIADAFGSIDCLPVPHASVATADLAAGQTVWDQCYAALQDLKKLGMVDGDDEPSILFTLGDRPGTVRIVPGDERDPVVDPSPFDRDDDGRDDGAGPQ